MVGTSGSAGFVGTLFVGLGGAVGAMARYGLSRAAATWWPAATLPLGTLIANVLGCGAIGFAATRMGPATHAVAWPLAVVGFLGGFTTFSTFGLEHVRLAGRSPMWMACHLAAHVGLGLAAAWLGAILGGGFGAAGPE